MKPWIWRSKLMCVHAVAGLRELVRVLQRLVAQRVVAGGQHQRRRQLRQVGVQQRRGAPVQVLRLVGDVVVVEVVHRVRGQQVALAVAGVRGPAAALVGGRVDQQLEAHRQVAGIAQRDRHHRGQVAAGAVAADRQARGIDAQLGGVVAHPARGGDAVVHRGREAVLRAHAVVHRHHRAAGGVGQLAAQRVVRVQVADDPAAAVVVHQHRRRALALRRGLRVVQAQRDRAVRAVGLQVAGLGDRRRVGLRHRAALAVEGACVGRRQRVRRRDLALDHQVEQELGMGVQHRVSCQSQSFSVTPMPKVVWFQL